MNNLNIKKTIISIENNIYYTLEFNYKINLDKIFNFKNENSQNINLILEHLLNYYIEEIKLSYNKKKYHQLLFLINDINKQCIIRAKNIVFDEANLIADDLIDKILNVNNRYIKLPVNLETLKQYSISSIVSKKDIDKVIKLIIIKLAITNYCLHLY